MFNPDYTQCKKCESIVRDIVKDYTTEYKRIEKALDIAVKGLNDIKNNQLTCSQDFSKYAEQKAIDIINQIKELRK